MSEPLVSTQDIENFHRDGAVCLRGVISQFWLDKITEGIQKNLEKPSKHSENLGSSDGPGFYFNDYNNWREIKEFGDFALDSPAAHIAASLMKSKTAVFYHEHVLTKDPGTFVATPWHQDQPYYPVDGTQNCSLWIPIDSISTQSTLRFIKGSHVWGRLFYPKKFATSLNYLIEQEADQGTEVREYEQVPDVEKMVDRGDVTELKWSVEPGDCVAFHMLTLHAASTNPSDTPRRVLSTRWLGDDAVYAWRPWTVSPPIDCGLKHGDSFQGDVFPLAFASS